MGPPGNQEELIIWFGEEVEAFPSLVPPRSMKILITGFGPFPGVEENPTETLMAEVLLKLDALADHEVDTTILRTAWDHVRSWVKNNLEDSSYDLVIHLGLAVESKRFRLESTGRNQVAPGTADQDGQIFHSEFILPQGPPTFPCPLPLSAFKEAFHAEDLPVVISDDAGGYLCNFLYVLSLDALQRTGRRVGVVFLHVPWISDRFLPPDRKGFPLQTHLAVLESLLGKMVPWKTSRIGG